VSTTAGDPGGSANPTTGPSPLSAEADAVAIAGAVQRGDVHPREVVAAAIERVEAANAELSFLIDECFERALESAETLDPSAPLAAVPVLVKDYFATVEGCRHSEGSAYLRDWTAPADSEYVARLRRAGAVILGVVSTPEFALLPTCEPRRYGVTRNPRALDRTTGGSSGASASAVASGAVPAAHGNDVGGSVRIPSSCCGTLGLKPTRGRNPLGPMQGDVAVGLFTEHAITRSARDSAAFLDATHGPAAGDPYAAPAPSASFRAAVEGPSRPLRIAVSRETPHGDPVAPECLAAVKHTVAALERLGHEIVEGAPSFDVEGTEVDFLDVVCAGIAASVDDWTVRLGRAPEPDELEPYTWQFVNRGRAHSGAELLGAVTRMQKATRQIAAFYEDVDLWLTPTLATLPVPLGHFEMEAGEDWEKILERDMRFAPFAWIQNVTGQPALSYPAHATEALIPVGVHFGARFGEEETLLALASDLEVALPPRPSAPGL
jgi:amidase